MFLLFFLNLLQILFHIYFGLIICHFKLYFFLIFVSFVFFHILCNMIMFYFYHFTILYIINLQCYNLDPYLSYNDVCYFGRYHLIKTQFITVWNSWANISWKEYQWLLRYFLFDKIKLFIYFQIFSYFISLSVSYLPHPS